MDIASWDRIELHRSGDQISERRLVVILPGELNLNNSLVVDTWSKNYFQCHFHLSVYESW